MSYGGVENTAEELAILKGATILDIAIQTPEERGVEPDLIPYSTETIVMRVRYRKGVVVADDQGEHTEGVFQVWQDEEGNGPGYIAYMGENGSE